MSAPAYAGPDAANNSPPTLACSNIVKSFGHVHALRGATMEVRAGEIVALIGDNGAGKSTLVKCLSGAHHPTRGTVLIHGKPVDISSIQEGLNLGIQMVYQDLALALHRSVVQNCYLGRELKRPGLLGRLGLADLPTMETRTRGALAALGVMIEDVSRPVSDLSGGQRQVVAVARAMPWATTALIMDEPTAALGVRQSHIVYESARKAADTGLAVLMISHDIPRMLEFADRIAILRSGRVVAQLPASSLTLEEVMLHMLGDRDARRLARPAS